MTIIKFQQGNSPLSREETMTVRGSNNAIGSQSLTVRRDRIEAAFSAKANLTAVLNGPAIISDVLATEARAALRRMDARGTEDVDAWATKLGNDLGSFRD